MFWLRIGLLLFQLACFGAGDSGFDGGFAWINLFFWFRISLLLLFQLACFGTGNSSFDGGFAWINLFFWFRIGLLLFQLARFGACNSRFDGSFARIDLLFWFGISLLLFQLACFGTGNSGFDGGFARINLLFWLRIGLLLLQLACFGAGNSRFNGSFTWISNGCSVVSLLQFCLFRSGLRFTGFPCCNNCTVIRAFARFNHNRLCSLGLFLFHPRQSGSNRIFIFGCRLNGCALMSFKASRFFALQTSLARFETRFGFCGALFFLTNSRNFSFFLTEILHQGDIARANPRASPTFNAVGNVMRGGFIVLLTFAEPVQLLRQKIRRAGVSTGATTDATLFFLWFAKFIGRGSQKTVGNLYDRDIQPR
ncbi:hypothetical protein HmCmsJML135_02088 [Escherichia coli]|nr:hypothetical protein HmCmsJML014_02517 [Escherichia coli]GCZ18992.1 hypothetical protein HmCmsJML135_02088 [Escherichia coli]